MPRLKPIDKSQVLDLQAMCRTTFYDTFIAITPEEDMATFLEEDYAESQLVAELDNPDSQYFFLYEGEVKVGYLKLNTGLAQTEPMPESYLEIQRLYILPEHQRQGYGKFLMDYALAYAEVEKFPAVWLGVWEKNFPAQALYKKMGFVRTGEHVFQVGNDAQIDYIMTKMM